LKSPRKEDKTPSIRKLGSAMAVEEDPTVKVRAAGLARALVA
jgi:hypothetical protein